MPRRMGKGKTKDGRPRPAEFDSQSPELKGVCLQFVRGQCNRGSVCRFSHQQRKIGAVRKALAQFDSEGGAQAGGGGGAAGAQKPQEQQQTAVAGGLGAVGQSATGAGGVASARSSPGLVRRRWLLR